MVVISEALGHCRQLKLDVGVTFKCLIKQMSL